MALAVDGFHVLKMIGQNAKVFAAVDVEVTKQAIALFSKQLKKADLGNVRQIYRAIGADDFRKMVDIFKGVGPVLKRLDKHNPRLKVLTMQDQRQLLAAIARGDTQPHERSLKAKAGNKLPKRSAKKKEKGIMDFESMKVRER
jgi:hypothetical protein